MSSAFGSGTIPSRGNSTGRPVPERPDPDQWYWDAIEKYKNDPEAYAYLSDNPWLRKDNIFSPSLGSQLLGLFGDNSAEDNFYTELHQKAMNYLSDWENRMYQQKYDSPVEQVKREAAAGINSDLAPQSISPGAAAENDQPFETTGFGNQPQINVLELGSTIVSTAFQCITGIQQMKSLYLDNAVKSLSVNDSLRSTAWDLIKSGIGEFVEGNSQFKPGDFSGSVSPEFIVSVSKYFQDRLDRLPYNRGEKKKLRAFTDALIKGTDEVGLHSFNNDFQKLISDSIAELSESRHNAVESSGKIGADAELGAAMRFISKDIYKPLFDLQQKVNKLLLNKDSQYLNRFNSPDAENGLTGGQMQADSERADFMIRASMRNIKNEVLKSFEQINERITKSKDIPSGWKFALQAGISTAEASVMSKFLGM